MGTLDLHRHLETLKFKGIIFFFLIYMSELLHCVVIRAFNPALLITHERDCSKSATTSLDEYITLDRTTGTGCNYLFGVVFKVREHKSAFLAAQDPFQNAPPPPWQVRHVVSPLEYR